MTEGADVSFVHLGITIEHLRNSISIGGFEIAFYGIIIGIGMLAGLYMAQKDARRRGQDPELYLDFALYAIIFSIIGARLYYVIFDWELYKDNPIEIFNLRGGGLAIYGGIIGAVLTLIVFTKVRKVSFFSMADTGCIGLITGQIIGRWGNFFNQEAYGAAVKSLNYLPSFIRDQMYIDGSYRQPTFLYESSWNLLGFLLILILRRKPQFLRQGEITAFYLIWYGFGRMIIEGMRTDSLMFAGLRVSQWLSMILILVGLAIIIYQRRKKAPYYVEAKE